MSSNAFARSRPRVRHQRIPKTQTCDHPRFLLLCDEIKRALDVTSKTLINRSKRKRTSGDYYGSCCSTSVNAKCPMSLCPAVANTSSNINNNATNKKLKSSVETQASSENVASRPLSPSFTKCPICLLDSMERDPSFTNTCFHLFCYVCIESWAKDKATCPLCRTEFTKIIYNIKSVTSYEEKIARPARRDDDDALLRETIILERFRMPGNRIEPTDVGSFPPEFLVPPNFLVNAPLEQNLRESLAPNLDPNQRVPSLSSVPRHFNMQFNELPNMRFERFVVPTLSSTINASTTATITTSTSDIDPSQNISNVSRRSRAGGRYLGRNYSFGQIDPSRLAGPTAPPPNLSLAPIDLDRHRHHIAHHHPVHPHNHNHHHHHFIHHTHQHAQLHHNHPHPHIHHHNHHQHQHLPSSNQPPLSLQPIVPPSHQEDDMMQQQHQQPHQQHTDFNQDLNNSHLYATVDIARQRTNPPPNTGAQYPSHQTRYSLGSQHNNGGFPARSRYYPPPTGLEQMLFNNYIHDL